MEKTMTSDDKRLEVAASLRESANAGGARTLKRELARALGIRLDDYTAEGSHSKILRGLADLIDPTCRMRPVLEGFRCSACGTYHDMSGFEEFPWPRCPECGARVVRTND